MRVILFLPLITTAIALLWSCGSSGSGHSYRSHDATYENNQKFVSRPQITQALIPAGTHGRHRIRRMSPQYITIHSTQNYSRGAGARAHASILGSPRGRHDEFFEF